MICTKRLKPDTYSMWEVMCDKDKCHRGVAEVTELLGCCISWANWAVLHKIFTHANQIGQKLSTISRSVLSAAKLEITDHRPGNIFSLSWTSACSLKQNIQGVPVWSSEVCVRSVLLCCGVCCEVSVGNGSLCEDGLWLNVFYFFSRLIWLSCLSLYSSHFQPATSVRLVTLILMAPLLDCSNHTQWETQFIHTSCCSPVAMWKACYGAYEPWKLNQALYCKMVQENYQ